jgi:hypothetical protein
MGPDGPPGPQGPQGDQGPKGPKGDSAGEDNSIFGSITKGIANGVANAITSKLLDSTFGLLALGVSGVGLALSAASLATSLTHQRGAAGSSGLVTLSLLANLNLNGARIENIAQSPGGDFDAVSARWVWDLINDNVEIKWQS